VKEVTGISRQLTNRGTAFAGGALLLFIAGAWGQDGALMTLGLLGLILVAGCFFLAPLNLRGLELRLQLPHRFHAARRVPLEAELWNPRRLLDAYQVEISMRFPQKVERSGYADWTPAGSRSVLRSHLSIPFRSCAEEVGYEIHSRFPLGLFEARLTSAVSFPLLVYPRPIAPPGLPVDGFQSDALPLAGAVAGELFGEPRGIRLYQPGDAANRIHQSATARSLARGHGIRVRAYDPPGFYPAACRIVFHSRAASGKMIRFDRFERGLSLVAGTLAHFRASPSKVSLQAYFTQWHCRPCETRAQFLDCLSLLARVDRPVRTKDQELAELLQGVPAEEQIVIISDSPAADWVSLIPGKHRKVIVIDIREARFQPRPTKLTP